MGALVRVESVVVAPGAGVQAAFVDVPREASSMEAQAVDVHGWALGSARRVVAVEARCGGRVVGRARTGVPPRPDLAAAFPTVPAAADAGFRLVVDVCGREPDVELELLAVLDGGTRAGFAEVRGTRAWRASNGVERDLVSVVIPCYRQARFLPDAIESVLAQTYPSVEIVVVDDGSPDETAAVATRYPGLLYVRQENQGLAAARNTGIRHTNGDYLVFLDADDLLLPHALEVGVRHLRESPEAAFASGTYEYVDADGRPLPTHDQRVEGDPYVALLQANIAGMPGTVVFRRAVFEHVVGFDGRFRGCEDYELYLRIARRFVVVCHGTRVGLYRQHNASMSRDSAGMLAHVLAVMRRELRFVRGDPDLRAPYAQGRRFWREYYGGPLRDAALRAARERRWRDALAAAATLARHDPRALLAGRRPVS